VLTSAVVYRRDGIGETASCCGHSSLKLWASHRFADDLPFVRGVGGRFV